MHRFEKALFITSLFAVFFIFGYICHLKKIFPYSLIEKATIAAKAVVQQREDEQKHIPDTLFIDGSGLTGPKITKLSSEAGTELLFFVGSGKSHLDL